MIHVNNLIQHFPYFNLLTTLNGIVESSKPVLLRQSIGYKYIGVDHVRNAMTQTPPNIRSSRDGGLKFETNKNR